MGKAKNQRGTVIVEASLALPFFMFAIYTLLSIVQIAYTQVRVAVALDSATKQLSEYVHVYYAVGLDETFTGTGGKSSDLANQVSEFLQEMGEQLGTIDDELGQFVDETGQALHGKSITALAQTMAGSGIAKQMLMARLGDGPNDTAEDFMKRNRITNLNMDGSKFMESGEGSTGKDIFMRVNYDIKAIQFFHINVTFHLSHCAYTQAWTGEE